MTTVGGGWTIFQRRLDGSVDFYRGWKSYKNGFGNPNGEFWLGLDKINRLTKSTSNVLRIDMEDTGGNSKYANYGFFAVSSEKSKYQLSLGLYSGEEELSQKVKFICYGRLWKRVVLMLSHVKSKNQN